nr:ubiquitin carboxyl-terminal hydrolase 10-like [Labrus bergylta]
MLTRWMALTAFLSASADLVSAAFGDGSLTVAPTCRLKGHPEVELTLSCGDERKAGIVQYWHTPFGDLETPGTLSKLDPVFMHHDGSLVVPNTSHLHSGLYYCLLQHKEGTTLWSYELNVGHNNQTDDEDNAYEEHRCGAFRIRRDVGSAEEKQGGVSDEQFAGVVAASVLLTFVLGFSAGALTRTQVLRCLGAVTMRLRSPWQRQSDTLDHGSEVNMTTLPPMYENQAFAMERVELDEGSETCGTADSTISSTASSPPPAKPQRSFRQKREEEQETTAYLEGCDYIKVKEEEEEERKGLKENSEGNNGEERGISGSFYLSDKDGGSKTETDEDECSEDPRESREEERQRKQEEELEEPSSSSTGDEEDGRVSEDKVGDNKEKGGEEKREEGLREEKEADEVENKAEEDEDVDICRKDDPHGENKEDTMKSDTTEGEEEPPTSPSSEGRRSRVIRLYQYDDDGQRYGHLPDPTPDEPGPAPRLKQRSLSLTRLNAIMAAASAGPLDTRETGTEGKEERPHFQMEI